jgi:hypothetical protein
MTTHSHVAHRNRSLRAARITSALVATLTTAGMLLTGHLLQLADPSQAAVVPGTQTAATSAQGSPR